jgi:DDE superfamily endonuclease
VAELSSAVYAIASALEGKSRDEAARCAGMNRDEHVAMVMDRAGWHFAKNLKVPENITLVRLPPYSPELNPVESIWRYIKDCFLSHRLLDDYDAIVDAICDAWNRLVAETGRVKSLCTYPWIEDVII